MVDGDSVKVVASGIGTTHIMPGWLQVLDTDKPIAQVIGQLAARNPAHPYALAGADAVQAGIAMFRQVIEPAGLRYSVKAHW
jgi:anaerobic glycerol-3-phosphate dehydrogenase